MRPNRRAARIFFILGTAALAAGGGIITAQAASPSSGTVSWSHPTQTWSGSGMAGSVELESNTTCPAEGTACDDFSFTLDTKRAGAIDHNALLDIELTPTSPGATFAMFVYAPGCQLPDSGCRNDIGTGAKLVGPANGTWGVRVRCEACPPGSSYSASAALSDAPPPKVPANGDAALKFAVQPLSQVDASGHSVSFGEPGMWFNSKGYGIVNSFGPAVWITKDDGKTWSKPVNLGGLDTACIGGGGDADGVVGEDGTFYVENLCIGNVGGTSGDIFVNQAGGDPSKWTGPSYAGMNVDRQWLTPDPKTPGTAYIEYHDLEGPDINVLKTTDAGTTWVCPLTGLPASGPCPITLTANSNTGFIDTGTGNTTARLLVDPTDAQRLYVAYADNCAINSELTPPNSQDFDLTRIHVAVSTDGGTTWQANTSKDNSPALDANAAFGQPSCSTLPPGNATDTCGNRISHTFPTAAIDQAGNLYVVFSLKKCNETQTHLWLIHSTDHGATWSKPVQVDSGGINSNIFQWVVGGSPGRIGITWYASPANDFNDHSAQWSEMYAVSTDALDSTPTFLQRNLTPNHSIHNADICEAGTLCLATGGNRNLSDFQMVAIGADGSAQAVWTDDSTGAGITMVARQLAGPKLVVPSGQAAVSAATATTTPFTAALAYVPFAYALGFGLAGGGVVLLALGGLVWRRRS